MTNKIKVIIGVAAIAVIALSITAIAFLPVSWPGANYGPKIEFKIQKGDGLNTIADNLYSTGLIRCKLAFKVYAVASRRDKSLQAGTYKVSTNNSVRELVNMFSGGLAEDQSVTVTIPEGSNINDIDLIFASAGLSKKGDFLNQDTVKREGFLFPDTYKFLPASASSETISDMAGRLYQNFKSRTTDISQAHTNAVIVASILEKEVKTKEDMALVAGIIYKRMGLDMPLQIDATVAYGECLSKFLAGQNCEVTEVNLIAGIKHDQPYNTYKHQGLPPGPISNPGLTAIEAALNPTASDYLYYLTDKDGDIYYAKTAADHQRNRQLYLNR